VYIFNIPSILLLAGILLLSNAFDRSIQKKIRLLSIIYILKSFVGTLIVGLSTYNYIKSLKTTEWNDSKILLPIIFCLIEFLNVLLGIFMARKTKQIIQILELEFFNKEWSNYFQINSEF